MIISKKYVIALIVIVLALLSQPCNGKPTFSKIESIENYEFMLPYNEPLRSYDLKRLGRGYYYIEDGYITAIPDGHLFIGDAAKTKPKQDKSNDRSSATYSSREDSLKPYRQTRANHKKLFVPNLFG